MLLPTCLLTCIEFDPDLYVQGQQKTRCASSWSMMVLYTQASLGDAEKSTTLVPANSQVIWNGTQKSLYMFCSSVQLPSLLYPCLHAGWVRMQWEEIQLGMCNRLDTLL